MTPLFIDDDIGSLSTPPPFVVDPESLQTLPAGHSAMNTRFWQNLQKPLGKQSFGANSHRLGILRLNFSVIVRTERLQIFASDGAKIEHVKIDQHVFAS